MSFNLNQYNYSQSFKVRGQVGILRQHIVAYCEICLPWQPLCPGFKFCQISRPDSLLSYVLWRSERLSDNWTIWIAVVKFALRPNYRRGTRSSED